MKTKDNKDIYVDQNLYFPLYRSHVTGRVEIGECTVKRWYLGKRGVRIVTDRSWRISEYPPKGLFASREEAQKWADDFHGVRCEIIPGM